MADMVVNLNKAKANKLNKAATVRKTKTADSKEEKTAETIEKIADVVVKANAKVAHAQENNQLLPLKLSLKRNKGQ